MLSCFGFCSSRLKQTQESAPRAFSFQNKSIDIPNMAKTVKMITRKDFQTDFPTLRHFFLQLSTITQEQLDA